MDEQDAPKKRCTGPCGQEYPATAEFFYRDKAHKFGLTRWCKKCDNERTKSMRTRPEPQERAKARQKVYERLPETKKRVSARRKAHYSNPETRKQIRDYQATYSKRPEVQESHRKRSRVNVHNRRVRKLSIPGTHTPSQIQDQLKRQKHKCYYCQKRLQKVKGRYTYHIEHTFPLSRVAGTDIPANSIDYLVLSCPTCNLSKGDKFPWEFPDGGRLL